jgi:4-hydroxybenzoate polyprenyltransferase
LALVPILLSASFLLSLLLPVNFMLILGVYFACTLAYSSYFKQIVIIDIILLALLYAVRVLAGGYAAEVEVSHWLLAFSLFFFLSLACAKRVAEIFRLRKAEQSSVKGRGYRAGDLEQIAQFGSSAGYISCLVLALYISSKEVVTLYPRPQFLWLICPLLLYWISRVWLLAHRGELQEDPILFAIRDRASYLVGLLSALLMLLAAF